jgi:hypothetical protein
MDPDAIHFTKPTVDVVTSCYEATYRSVLSESYWRRVAAQHGFSFYKRIALINNVESPSIAADMAAGLRANGVIDEWYFVADFIDAALSKVGLRYRDLGRIAHYSTGMFAAVSLCTADYLLFWDADVELLQPHDWITPSLTRLEAEPDLLVANPLWNPHRIPMQAIRAESQKEDADFFIGYGFSDQVFLARKSDLERPIYNYFHPYSRRYPLAHIAAIFEQRVDSYMRRTGRMRLTYKHAGYCHPQEGEGRFYPGLTFVERCKKVANRAITATAVRFGAK